MVSSISRSAAGGRPLQSLFVESEVSLCCSQSSAVCFGLPATAHSLGFNLRAALHYREKVHLSSPTVELRRQKLIRRTCCSMVLNKGFVQAQSDLEQPCFSFLHSSVVSHHPGSRPFTPVVNRRFPSTHRHTRVARLSSGAIREDVPEELRNQVWFDDHWVHCCPTLCVPQAQTSPTLG